MTTWMNVRTETVELPGNQVVRVSFYDPEDVSGGTLVITRGWRDGLAVAGVDGESTLTLPGTCREKLIEALTRLEEGEG